MQLEHISSLASRYNGQPIHGLGLAPSLLLPSLDLDMDIYSRHLQEPMGNCTDLIPVPSMTENPHLANGGLITEQEKPLALDLAMTAMDELVKMCQATEPLWIQSNNGTKEVLNLEEHTKMFPWPMNFNQHQNEFRTEATRGSALVIMNSITLVDAFLDAVSSHSKQKQVGKLLETWLFK